MRTSPLNIPAMYVCRTEQTPSHSLISLFSFLVQLSFPSHQALAVSLKRCLAPISLKLGWLSRTFLCSTLSSLSLLVSASFHGRCECTTLAWNQKWRDPYNFLPCSNTRRKNATNKNSRISYADVQHKWKAIKTVFIHAWEFIFFSCVAGGKLNSDYPINSVSVRCSTTCSKKLW